MNHREESPDDLLHLARICTEFENNWEQANGPVEILNLVKQNRAGSHVALELATIDLERNWRAFSNHLLNSLQSNQPPDPNEHSVAFPGWRAYLEKLDCLHELAESLQLAEWQIRHQYGDAPSRKCFPELADDKRSDHSITITIRSDNQDVFRANLSTPVELGRQMDGEPDPVSILDKGRRRVVVARKSDRTISRRQATIRVVADKVLSVENNSRNRSFTVASGRAFGLPVVIAPGESSLVLSPLTVSWGSLRIQIQRFQPSRRDSASTTL